MGLDMNLFKVSGVHLHENVAKYYKTLESHAKYMLEVLTHYEGVSYTDPGEKIIQTVNELLDIKRPALMQEAGLVDFDESEEPIEVAYWRKHADLNEYMTNLYYEKTPEDCQASEFNCVRLLLTKDDLLDLMEKVVKELANPGTEFKTGHGFFWGETARKDWIETLDILNKVIESTDFKKETIYYSCWY